MPTLALIVALDERRGIGKEGTLPWRLRGDLQHFRATTLANPGFQNVVLMGRKTWESLPAKVRPLPGRFNLILSRTLHLEGRGYQTVESLEEAWRVALALPKVKTVFVIGGTSLYELALKDPRLERCYLTRVKGDFESDTFFPPLPSFLELTYESPSFSEKGVVYNFELREKRQ